MKVILSRKGFDSSTGGIPSAIIGNDMISFPIPENQNSGIKVEDVFQKLKYDKMNYSDILCSLGYDKNNRQTCHIDPDLDNNRRSEPIPNWVPIYGQSDQAASYLLNTVNVQPGDLFLFFGNFHFVEKTETGHKFTKNSNDFYHNNDLQVIWGYLQIGEIVTDKERQQQFNWHPHSAEYYTNKSNDTKNKSRNVMFIASERLSFDKTMPGYGVLTYQKNRVLTKKDCTKAIWKMERAYECVPSNTAEGYRRNSAKDKKTSIYYQGRWQELVLTESTVCDEWATKILKSDFNE